MYFLQSAFCILVSFNLIPLLALDTEVFSVGADDRFLKYTY